MKNHLFILVFLSNLSILFPQDKLKIEYEVIPYFETDVKSNFEIIDLPSLFELIIFKEKSLYKYIPKISNTQLTPSNSILATMSADTNPVFKNIENSTYIEEAKIGEKTFLISDNLPQINWKITKEKKEIEGFYVFKATAILNDEYKTNIEAWYSPKLSYKIGPDKFWGLPGIILELKTEIINEDGSKEGTKYLVTKVEILNSGEELEIPNKGKIISRNDFEKVQKMYFQNQMEAFSEGVDKD